MQRPGLVICSQGGQEQVVAGQGAVGQAVLLQAGQRGGQGAGQGERLVGGERAFGEQDVLPGWAGNPGHEGGEGEVGVALKQVGVVGRGEDGAAGGLQAGQVGEGGKLLGLGEQGGGAEAGFEDLEGGALTPDPAPGGSGEEVVDGGSAPIKVI